MYSKFILISEIRAYQQFLVPKAKTSMYFYSLEGIAHSNNTAIMTQFLSIDNTHAIRSQLSSPTKICAGREGKGVKSVGAAKPQWCLKDYLKES